MSLPDRPMRRENIETHLMPDGSALLYDPATGKGHVLNVTGSFIWEYCDGTMTPDQIAAELAGLLPQEVDFHAEALHMIADLAALDLFVPAPDASRAGLEENA